MALILNPLVVLLLLSLEIMLTMMLLIILHWSLSLLCCRSIREILMVSQGWCRVRRQVDVWLKTIVSISIEKLCLLNLIRTLMG